MSTDPLTQTCDWPGEPVSCCPQCPNPACAAQATMLLATPGWAELRCPNSGAGYPVAAACAGAGSDSAEVTYIPVRADLLPHAEETR